MGPPVQRPSGVNVGVFNPGDVVYIRGDENTDGSIRIIPDVLDENADFQLRKDGVWNDTGLQIAASTVHLGRDLRLAGAGEWLSTSDVVTAEDSLIPHVSFTDLGTQKLHTPILNAKITRSVIQPDDSVDLINTILEMTVASPIDALRSRIYLRTGSVGSTEPVEFTLRRGSSTGPIFWMRTLSAPLLATPNTEVEIEIEGLVEGFVGESVHASLISEASFSIRANPSNIWWIALDYFPLATVDVALIAGNAVSFFNDISGADISISGANAWTDIDDGGVDIIWALSPSVENFTLTDADNGEITYDGIVDYGFKLGGSVEVGGMAGMDGIEIGVSVNGADPTADTITCGFVTPVQLDSITIPPARVPIEIGDTLKLQCRNITNGSGFTFYQAKNVVF